MIEEYYYRLTGGGEDGMRRIRELKKEVEMNIRVKNTTILISWSIAEYIMYNVHNMETEV